MTSPTGQSSSKTNSPAGTQKGTSGSRVLQRFFGVFVTVLAVALWRNLIDWWNSPPTVRSDEATQVPEWISFAVAFVVIAFLFFLIRRAVEGESPASWQSLAASLFSYLEFIAPNGIRLLIGINIAALLVAAVGDLTQTDYKLIHALVFVTMLTTIYLMDRRRHVVWLGALGLFGILYCPVVHIVTRRSTWQTADWLCAITLVVLLMLTVPEARQIKSITSDRGTMKRWNYKGFVIVVQLREHARTGVWKPVINVEKHDGASVEVKSLHNDSLYEKEDQGYLAGYACGRRWVDDLLAGALNATSAKIAK